MKKQLLLLVATAIIFASCSKNALNDISDEESRLYITNHDASANFSSFATYSVSDSIAVIDNGQYAKQAMSSTDLSYAAAIDKYMQQRGYTKVARSSNPDIGITINHVFNTRTIAYDNYWNYYNSFWDPYYWGYGGYGYGFPYSFGIYQVTEGALSIDMFDLKNASTKNQISILWNGLIRGENFYNSQLSDGQVKALFDQSNYIVSE